VKYHNVQMLGIAHVDAPETVSSEEIESRLAPALRRLGIPKGILRKLTGIESRQMFDPSLLPSEGALMAAERAIEATGIDSSNLGVVVNTSVCRDAVETPTASIVHQKLGLAENCMSFDVGNACLGFINGMDLVATMIEREQINHGMVVNCSMAELVWQREAKPVGAHQLGAM
jgi:3-oxoacyl-[acyl-carrier-protein] synthase-3